MGNNMFPTLYSIRCMTPDRYQDSLVSKVRYTTVYINTSPASPASPAPKKCINASPAMYINTSPAPEKCINTSPAVYINTSPATPPEKCINTSPASPAPEKCINTSPAVYINTSLAMQALYKYFYGAGEVYINTSPAFFGDGL